MPAHGLRRAARPLAGLALLLAAAAGAQESVQKGVQEIEGSDLTELWASTETDLAPLAADVEARCRSLEQVRSVPLFTELIERVERLRPEGGELDEQQRGWLRLALSCRAEALFNLRRESEAEADLRWLYELEPGYDAGAGGASRRLVDLATRIRGELIGDLRIGATPADLTVTIDGAPLASPVGATVPLRAGGHRLAASRPGFASVELELEIVAGKTEIVELELERVSAVLAVWTQPCAVAVTVDGEPAGVTAAPPPPPPVEPVDPGGEIPAVDPGCVLEIDGLGLGGHVLELTREGYRGVRAAVEVEALLDLALPLQELEPTGGEVVLRGLRPGSSVRVDDVEQSGLEIADGGTVRLELAVGAHLIEVAYDTLGFFVAPIQLEDQEVEELAVVLRPRIAFLGILGGDPEAGADLESELDRSLGELQRMGYGPAACALDTVVAQFGITAQKLRDLADAEPAVAPPWEDERLQAVLDSRCRASAYLLAVLPEATFPDRADLWLWAAAPGPARATRHRLRLPAAEALARLRVSLDTPISLERPWVGARFIDSQAAPGPVVVTVAGSGPAAAAGLRPGDAVTGWGGEPLGTRAALRRAIDGAEPGLAVTIDLEREGEPLALELTPASGPRVISPVDRRLHPAAVAADLALFEGLGPQRTQRWVLDLNWAAAFMLAEEWGQAARRLDQIEAPAKPGVGRALVEYWFARALLRDAGSAYRGQAVAALESAAADAAARLGDHDGALVAPRARILLEALRASGE